MKKFKNYLKTGILIFGCFFLFTNCEKENNYINLETLKPQKVSKITFTQFNDNTITNDKLNLFTPYFDIIKAQSKEVKFKSNIKSTTNSIILTDNILRIENDNITTYTFKVLTEYDDSDTFFNLVLSVDNNNNEIFKSNIFEYKPTKKWLKDKSKPFEGTVAESKNIIFNLDDIITFGNDNCLLEVKGVWECNLGNEHYPGHPSCTGGTSWTFTYVYVYGTCSGGGSNDPISFPNDIGNNIGGGDLPDGPGTATSPIIEGPEHLNQTNIINKYLLNKLSIDELNWLDENELDSFKILTSLDNHNNNGTLTLEVLNLVKGTIQLETYNSKIIINYNPGKIKGRDDLKYTHIGTDGIRTVYKLETGDLVLSSIQQEYLNNYENGIWTSEVSNNEYWYIKPIDTGEWAQFLVKENFTNLSSELDTLFKLGTKLGAKFFGRYVLPVEDVKILITGTDFDGQQANQYLTTGMLLISVVPGGKLLKAVPKIAKGTKVWRIVLKEGTHNYTRIIKEISETSLQKFDNAAPNIRTYIDEALRKNEFLDNVIEEVAEIVEDLAEKKGRKLSWTEVKALFKRGKDFDDKAGLNYAYNQINLSDGLRLDSYIPGIEIVSRKATDLQNIKVSTFKSYLSELITKYKKGKIIRSNKYNRDPFNIDGHILSGEYFLEIPSTNKSFFENSIEFQNALYSFNTNNNVIIKIKYAIE